MLARWLEADPHDAAQQAIAAAEDLDQKVEALLPGLVKAILGTTLWGRRRPWVLDRSIHRSEHLDEIEKALVQ